MQKSKKIENKIKKLTSRGTKSFPMIDRAVLSV
jgi:hypothetical protein